MEKTKRYKCLSCDSPNCVRTYECINAIQCWKARAVDSEGSESVSRGCTTDPLQIQYCGPQRLNTLTRRSQLHSKYNTKGQFAFECCYGDYCNNGSFPDLPFVNNDVSTASEDRLDYVLKLTGAVLGPLIFLGALTVAVILYMKYKYKKKPIVKKSSHDENACASDSLVTSGMTVSDRTVREYMEQSVTSGSGFGLPLLMQRTLGRQITLVELIGKGRYGEVWHGILSGERVAVKIFLSKDEKSWRRETEIYNTIMMRHDNILEYIGSDITSRNSFTQFWLVTDYQPLGSLYDYLNKNVISYKEMIKLCLSAINGIEYLHAEILSCENKPPIAHRDVKSKNILVKSDGRCVIADFGLAVSPNPRTGEIDIEMNVKVGTKRYMAPELLDETIDLDSIESFKRADIYSFGLVIWEVCWRTLCNGIAEDYRVPFYECTQCDPSFEDMHRIVCLEQRRPVLPNRWFSDSVLNEMVRLMRECWHQNSSVRLTALRIKKNIGKISKLKMADCEYV